MNIREFKKGDEIVRVKAAKTLNNPMPEIDFFGMHLGGGMSGGDRSYLGDKLIFVGIANGMIYVENNDAFHAKVLNKTKMDLALDLWDEDWEYWVDPESLGVIDYGAKEFETARTKESIERQIIQCIDKEDYETAEKLKEELKKFD